MKLIWIVPILAGLLCTQVFAQKNYVRNGNFETWNGALPDHWQMETSDFTVVRDTSEQIEGSNAAKITLMSKTTQILFQDSIPVVGGNSYRLMMQVKDNDEAGRLRFWGYWSGHEVSGGPQAPSYSSDAEEWQTYEMQIDVPGGASFMKLEIRLYDVSSKWDGEAVFLIDDVKLEPLTALKPDIYNVTDSVFYEASVIHVDAHVHDDNGIDEVWLYYSVNGSTQMTRIDMTWQENERWSGEIPPCEQQDRLAYCIVAEDDETNVNSTATDTFKVIIGRSTISSGRQQNNGGMQEYNGYKVRFSGVVTVPSNAFSEKSQNIYIQDQTAGINIYTDEKRSTDFISGDSVEVVGWLDQIAGRSILIPEQIKILATERALPEILVITCTEVGEDYEGQLVEIRDISIEGWTEKTDTSFRAIISDGSGDTEILIHHETDIDGHPDPAAGGTVNLIGIVSQSDPEYPYTEGYCILPRSWIDFMATAIEQNDLTLSFFELYQNHPNPFNPVTHIRYSLERKSHVEIRIYDVLGCLVDEIVQGIQPAGMYSVHWDGSGFASGVYFCLLQAGEFRKIRKMILAQ